MTSKITVQVYLILFEVYLNIPVNITYTNYYNPIWNVYVIIILSADVGWMRVAKINFADHYELLEVVTVLPCNVTKVFQDYAKAF